MWKCKSSRSVDEWEREGSEQQGQTLASSRRAINLSQDQFPKGQRIRKEARMGLISGNYSDINNYSSNIQQLRKTDGSANQS